MRPCGAPGASSSGHSLEVIVLHLVPATATATAGPHPLALHSCPYHQRLRCSGQEAASTSGGSKWASQDTSGHWPCVNALARHTKATLCQTSTSVQGLPASPALSKTGHRYLWGWKLPVSGVQQGESQPMQIQQVLAVTEGHREKRHRETAVPFELVHERRHLSARCLALKGSLQ